MNGGGGRSSGGLPALAAYSVSPSPNPLPLGEGRRLAALYGGMPAKRRRPYNVGAHGRAPLPRTTKPYPCPPIPHHETLSLPANPAPRNPILARQSRITNPYPCPANPTSRIPVLAHHPRITNPLPTNPAAEKSPPSAEGGLGGFTLHPSANPAVSRPPPSSRPYLSFLRKRESTPAHPIRPPHQPPPHRHSGAGRNPEPRLSLNTANPPVSTPAGWSLTPPLVPSELDRGSGFRPAPE